MHVNNQGAYDSKVLKQALTRTHTTASTSITTDSGITLNIDDDDDENDDGGGEAVAPCSHSSANVGRVLSVGRSHCIVRTGTVASRRRICNSNRINGMAREGGGQSFGTDRLPVA